MIIKKETTVYPSIFGHYNFQYPDTENPYVLTVDITVSILPWVRASTKKIPVRIISPENYVQHKVLWIDEPV